jgi:hypothetical protein
MWLPGISLPISVIICHDKRCECSALARIQHLGQRIERCLARFYSSDCRMWAWVWCGVVDPELVRLPVLCGARLIVYISWETWHDDNPVPRVEEELAPYLL